MRKGLKILHWKYFIVTSKDYYLLSIKLLLLNILLNNSMKNKTLNELYLNTTVFHCPLKIYHGDLNYFNYICISQKK